MGIQYLENHQLDHTKGQPIYKQLASALEGVICSDYKEGDYLPSENELAAHFNINRHTVRRATDDLVAAGFIVRRKGKGAMIINNQVEYTLAAGRFTDTLDKLRRQSHSVVLSKRHAQCTKKIADYLAIKEGASVIIIDTLRLVDDEPMSLITHHLNPEYVSGIDDYYQGGSLHDCIEQQCGVSLCRTSALISAVMPNNEEALHLKSSLVRPLLKIKSFNGLASSPEEIVEVSISRSRSDRFQIKV